MKEEIRSLSVLYEVLLEQLQHRCLIDSICGRINGLFENKLITKSEFDTMLNHFEINKETEIIHEDLFAWSSEQRKKFILKMIDKSKTS